MCDMMWSTQCFNRLLNTEKSFWHSRSDIDDTIRVTTSFMDRGFCYVRSRAVIMLPDLCNV